MDLFEGATGLVVATEARNVGVDDLDGFADEGKVGRVVGVADREPVDEVFLDGDGRLIEDFTPLEDAGSLGAILVVKVAPTGGVSSLES